MAVDDVSCDARGVPLDVVGVALSKLVFDLDEFAKAKEDATLEMSVGPGFNELLLKEKLLPVGWVSCGCAGCCCCGCWFD